METNLKGMYQLLLGEVISRNARKFPGKTALVWDGGSLSYGRMNERVNALARGLAGLGVKKGDKVALLFFNGPEILEACYAAFKLGAVAVPVNFRLAPPEIAYILNNCDAGHLIMGSEFIESVQGIRGDISLVRRIIVTGVEAPEGMLAYEALIGENAIKDVVVELEDDDDALILYTSGTTGRPKGAVLTHKGFLLNAMNWVMAYNTRYTDKLLCIPPLFHVASLGYSVTQFYAGATVYIEKDFMPSKVWEFIDREKITTLFLVPSMWIALLQVEGFERYDRSTLRVLNTGAAIMPVEVKKQLLETFPNGGLYDCFGQTEMNAAVTVLMAQDTLRKPASVGLPLPSLEVRAVDDDDNDVPVGEVGEAVYRGPTVMKEYYKNPEATREVMRSGWFHSGDLIKIDEDGFIYVVDRKKDMIISGGENVYPAEVEEVLYAHPDILEVAVFGVPDPKWGESVKATVVLKPGKKLTQEEVIEYCKKNLASYKKPKSIDFIDALPKSAAGKILKTTLRGPYWANLDKKI
ncbi:MAG: long-chain fatty acid--CoA ligase [Proteobacteria bacterium]|nr:long-chain fatty acid--CoA ligase [Pseudomonadota bacterium]